MEILKGLFDFIYHIDKHLADIMAQYHALTYLILFAIIFAETGFVVTPFLPGDSLLFASGLLIADGMKTGHPTGLDIYLLALVLIAAAFTGNTVNYLLGNYLGPKVFKPNNKILKLEYYNQTHAFFEKHGAPAVIFSRFMPIIRTIAPFVAGVGGMPFLKYSLYNIIGGASWIIVFLFAGYFLGTIPFFHDHFTVIGLAIILISIVPPIFAAIKTRSVRKAR